MRTVDNLPWIANLSPMASPPLRTIAGHRLIAGLGKGGMAIVFLAISQKQFGFTKLVVLKILREEMDVDEEFIQMFLQEARLAARLNHPNIVQTYEVGAEDGRHYIAPPPSNLRPLDEANPWAR